MPKKRRPKKPRGPKRAWALLAYIAGDNDLSDAGLEDIQEMCEEGASGRVHVGVEIDTYGEHTGSVRYEITEKDFTGEAHRTVIERLSEKDTGDPRTLQSFLQWGLERFNANDYLVVIWNHGAGFRTIRRDIGYDDFGTSLDMPEIETAFARAGISSAKPISVLGFDACLMNMLEIAHHFRGQVKYLVGSQQTEPGDGWPYDKVLSAIKAAASPRTLAREIVRVYMADYRRQGMSNVTQSAIDIDQTDPAVRALSELGETLAEKLPAYRDKLRNIRMATQMFQMADYVDLIHLARRIRRRIRDKEVRAAARRVIQTARNCIVESKRSGDSVRNARGVSVWFPHAEGIYANYRSKYLELKCSSEHPGWVRFLDEYHANP